MASVSVDGLFFLRNGPVTALRIVLILVLCSSRAVHADYNNRGAELDCTFGASINLTSVQPNAIGFFVTSKFIFPPEATRSRNGVLYGCICDIKICLLRCPLFDERGVEMKNVSHRYVNYSAIPRVYTTDRTIDDVAEAQSSDQRFYLHVQDPCPGKGIHHLEPLKYKHEEFYFLRNGSLFLPLMDIPIHRLWNSNEYCLDQYGNDSSYRPTVCKRNEPPTEPPMVILRLVLYIIAIATVPFLFATVIVYSVIPEFRNIHGIILRCYLCCLIVAYIALGVQQLSKPDDRADLICVSLQFLLYFAFLASYLWLNVMCFDVWLRFGDSKFFGTTDMQGGRKRIMWYSIYAWGIPAVLTTLCITMEFAPGDGKSVFHPGFMKSSCHFRTMGSEALYFYGLSTATTVCNICFFVATSVKMVQHNRTMQRHLSNADSRCHNDNKQWFGLNFKLFVLMGITWSTDIISWLWKTPNNLWYFTDIYNALQGILIFVILVCKKSIWRSLKKRFNGSRLRIPDPELPDRIAKSGCSFRSSFSVFRKSSRTTMTENLD